MQIATLSTKYQICIPKLIREQLHLEAGQQFIIITKGNGLHLYQNAVLNRLKVYY